MKGGASTVRDATAPSTCHSTTHSCTDCSATSWRVEVCGTLSVAQSITVRINNDTIPSWADFVTRPVSSKSYLTVSYAEQQKTAIVSRIVPSDLAYETDFVAWIFEMARPWNLTLLFDFDTHTPTYSNKPFITLGKLWRSPIIGVELDALAIWQPFLDILLVAAYAVTGVGAQ